MPTYTHTHIGYLCPNIIQTCQLGFCSKPNAQPGRQNSVERLDKRKDILPIQDLVLLPLKELAQVKARHFSIGYITLSIEMYGSI